MKYYEKHTSPVRREGKTFHGWVVSVGYDVYVMVFISLGAVFHDFCSISVRFLNPKSSLRHATGICAYLLLEEVLC